MNIQQFMRGFRGVAGTAVANKIAILGASKNLDVLGLPVGGLKIGAPGAEVAVTASAASLNAVPATSALLGTVAVAADVLPVPVTHRHVMKTTGADAEALSLANGVAGQRLTIVLAVDGGGDGTLTPTTKTGFATVVFADAGDHVTLEFVDATVGWILIGAAGVAAPPVISV